MKTINQLLLLICPLFLFSQEIIDDRDVPLKTVVHNDDVSIIGSLCVGFDCLTSESFGFDTQRLKENNLRIHFDDTSSSASFPANDWRIVINDSSNGGASHFTIQDASAPRDVFRIYAGARTHALVVDSQGDVGLGTSTPATDIDIKTGNTPTIRLQQDGTSGFTPQSWDLAGNETNFFIRDATNGSTLPFRIRPGSSSNSLYVDTGGEVGVNNSSPDANLHVIDNMIVGAANAAQAESLVVLDGNIQIKRTDGTASNMIILDERTNGSSFLRLKNSSGNWLIGQIPTEHFVVRNVTAGSVDPIRIDPASHAITTLGDITANSILLTSDMRLKENVNPFIEGLSIINNLNPIS